MKCRRNIKASFNDTEPCIRILMLEQLAEHAWSKASNNTVSSLFNSFRLIDYDFNDALSYCGIDDLMFNFIADEI
jgi:hypothetical protein